MDTVVVTGGCGYIGSHTCISLLNSSSGIDTLLKNFSGVYLAKVL